MARQVGELILYVIQIFTFALLGRAVLSWFDPVGRWPISRILRDITEPFVAPIRQIVPRTGMIDLSFLVAFFLLWLLQRLLAQALLGV
ncbi:MAG: YggT family protein [Chloroflexota bacterium]|nr:YggT family protein [Chloroflexota bacterium]